MLLVLLSLALFHVTNGLRGLCTNMTNSLCQKAALTYFNYTVNDISKMKYLHALNTEERIACKIEGECPTVLPPISGAKISCTDGNVRDWKCNNVDLLSFVPLAALGSSNDAEGNDIWGYTDLDHRMYAITGQTDGTSIVEVTDPEHPDVLCFIPSRLSANTIWRDIKVIDNFAYIVADRGGQGLQWLDLDAAIAKCRASVSKPLTLTEGTDFGWTATVYDGATDEYTNTHNLVVNQEVETLYIVGSHSCEGGLLAVDVSTVGNEYRNANNEPKRLGCFASDGYTHDAECVIYHGPDEDYKERNICFGYNEDSITIVDMSKPADPVMISRTTYDGSMYTHQGWLTDDHRYLLMNDELDETGGTVESQTTYVVDLRSGLAKPLLTRWHSGLHTIDHNLYIRGNYVYEANYKAGLRILSIENIGAVNAHDKLRETGYFKTYLNAMDTSFDGAWSVYPFFQQDREQPNVVIVQDINTGLYILDPTNAVTSNLD